ncbi:hypothetical protein LTR53_020652, partial [Teratosphaeriaceae sp. CCFEE 6253]
PESLQQVPQIRRRRRAVHGRDRAGQDHALPPHHRRRPAQATRHRLLRPGHGGQRAPPAVAV